MPDFPFMPVTIAEKIRAYHEGMSGPHHRYRSWEHCYRYFHDKTPEAIAADRDHAALQLGFYLASWGMYRGSTFLLQHAYTVHHGVIDSIVAPEFSVLWQEEIGDCDYSLIPVIQKAIAAIREAYSPFARRNAEATDTLVTKVLLGTFACLPACDTLFQAGFKRQGFKFSYLNEPFIRRVIDFCRDHRRELYAEQQNIEALGGMRYPLMKLVDMYFWQIGYDHADAKGREENA